MDLEIDEVFDDRSRLARRDRQNCFFEAYQAELLALLHYFLVFEQLDIAAAYNLPIVVTTYVDDVIVVRPVSQFRRSFVPSRSLFVVRSISTRTPSNPEVLRPENIIITMTHIKESRLLKMNHIENFVVGGGNTYDSARIGVPHLLQEFPVKTFVLRVDPRKGLTLRRVFGVENPRVRIQP